MMTILMACLISMTDIKCLSGYQLLVQYEQQPSSTTNVETTIPSPQIHQKQYTDYHIENYHEGPSSYTPIPYMPTNDCYIPHIEPNEFDIHMSSYTQFLSGSSNYYETTPTLLNLNEPSHLNAQPTTKIHVA